jgi:hypothetical protein
MDAWPGRRLVTATEVGSSLKWFEIDTIEDLRNAEKLFFLRPFLYFIERIDLSSPRF